MPIALLKKCKNELENQQKLKVDSLILLFPTTTRKSEKLFSPKGCETKLEMLCFFPNDVITLLWFS
jgi:hypothetical protein